MKIKTTLSIFALWLYLLSPLLIHAFINNLYLDPLFLFNLLTSILWISIFYFGVSRVFLLFIVLLPLFIATAIDHFLIQTFDNRLSSGYMTIALTDHTETKEFLLSYWRNLILPIMLLIIVYSGGLFLIKDHRAKTRPKLAYAAAASLAAIYCLFIGRSLRSNPSPSIAVLDLAGKEEGSPFGLLFQSALALQINAQGSNLRALRILDKIEATQANPKNEPELIVWVIGESSRPQNWSLFDYKRDTTPLLRSTQSILTLPNMLTTAPLTSIAVPSMLSLEPIDNWYGIASQKSIVSAFSFIGYKTYWLSVQEADNWAGLIPQVAAEANQRRYFDRSRDGVLIENLNKILKNRTPNERSMIVLHTKGSHFDFSRRYPPEFSAFTSEANYREKLVSSYDNSILYTDYILKQFINTLDSLKDNSILVYASDHGENLLDDQRQYFGHAIGTEYDLKTSAFFWFSQTFTATHQTQIATAKQNSKTPLSLSNLAHALLDVTGISTKGLDLQRSIFSEKFQSAPRKYIVRDKLVQE